MSGKEAEKELFQFKANLGKIAYNIFVYKHNLVFVPASVGRNRLKIDFEDIFALNSKNEHTFTLHTMKPGKKLARIRRDATFTSTNNIKQEIDKLTALVVAGTIAESIPERKLLILINPFGGPGQAKQIFENEVQEMFKISHVQTTVICTEFAGHAHKIVTETKVEDFHGVVSISGDGLVHEIVNGIFSRKDYKEVIKKWTFGVIPAGSGNALSRSLDLIGPKEAAFNIIKGHTHDIDIMAVHHENDENKKVTFSFLEILWGLYSDVDFESENFRFMGGSRFAITAVVRALSLRSYKARLSYLPEEKTKDIDDVINDPFQKRFPENEDWKVLDENFTTLSGMTVGWAAMDNFMSPYAAHDDGYIDLQFTLREETNPFSMTKMLLTLETGGHVEHPCSNYMKTKAFALQLPKPQPEVGGFIDIDGEKYGYEDIHVEVLPLFLRFYGPSALPLPSRRMPSDVVHSTLTSQSLTQSTLNVNITTTTKND